jgi:hypothetical protein
MSILTEALERIFKHFQQHRPELASLFKPGLTIGEIQSQMENLPFRLSEEIYELYQWRNGVDFRNFYASVASVSCNPYPDINFIPGLHFLPLEEAIEGYKEFEEGKEDFGSYYTYNTDDIEIIQKPWFPIFDAEDLGCLLVFGNSVHVKDLPLMYCDLGQGYLPEVQYTNLTSFMLVVAECYETNAYYLEKPAKCPDYLSYGLAENREQVTKIKRRYEGDLANWFVSVYQVAPM